MPNEHDTNKKLNSRQRAFLRGLANTMDAIFQVGKGGVNEQMINQLDEALTARELLKVRVLETSPVKASEAARLLSEPLGAQIVQIIGHTVVLYRMSDERKEPIALPK